MAKGDAGDPWTVGQSGTPTYDYSTLASALSHADTGANDYIEIRGTWSVPDTSACTVSDDNITVTLDSDSAHPGSEQSSPTHWRLVVSGGGHCITVNNTGFTYGADGAGGVIVQDASTGSSHECFRVAHNGTLTVNSSILRCDQKISNQDCIYAGNQTPTINVTQCVFIGANRCGMHYQPFSSTSSQTWNLNSCAMWDCGDEGADCGGVGCTSYSGGTWTIAAHNTWILDCSAGDEDWCTGQATANTTWDLHYCIDSDGSIATNADTSTGSLGNVPIRESTAGGAEVLVQDITTSPYDLAHVDDATNNDAQEMHAVLTANSLTIPATRIDGTARESADYHCGPYTIAAGAASLLLKSRMRTYAPILVR